MVYHQKNKQAGKVIIAGAGPGDPELITLKAFRFLQEADVIIVDRLVSEDLLLHVKKEAVIIIAGKQGRNDNSITQDQINSLIIENAFEHKLVLRLKGGDVSIFSNLLDELETLVTNNIDYEIIPGITAASGAAAMAGIPLTARGHATAVRFLTYYKAEMFSELEWKDLAATNDTLVFYMSANNVDRIVEKLLDNGISNEKYLAIIEQATTPVQKVQLFNLYEYELRSEKVRLASPSLIIIGRVARLHDQFKWIKNIACEAGDYFTPLKETKESIVHLTN